MTAHLQMLAMWEVQPLVLSGSGLYGAANVSAALQLP